MSTPHGAADQRRQGDEAAYAPGEPAHAPAPGNGIPAPGWIRRRARNVYRRPLLVGGVGAAVFVVTLLALAVIPRRARRAVQDAVPAASAVEHRRDSIALHHELALAIERDRAAEAALAHARDLVAAQSMPDTLSPELSARRDSLAQASANLARLLRRAEEAPLPTSYRELGTAPEMRGAPRVAQLLDTLAGVEKSRADFGAVGGVDPIFVALTARVTQIGKEIQAIAAARRAAIRREMAALSPAVRPAEAIDTAALALARDSAQYALTLARDELARARDAERAMAARAARERSAAAIDASVPAMLPAALIVGLVAGLSVAFALELRQPRIADANEAEAIAGLPVLAIIGEPRFVHPRRRRADREVPPLVELSSDDYQLLYTQLASPGFDLPLVTVAGDDPVTTATVAANLAATVARKARSTLLVDTDFDAHSVAAVVRMGAAPGLANVIAERTDWPAAVSSVVVGRSRTMDVLTSGAFGAAGPPEAFTGRVERTMERLVRRYECVVVSAPLGRGGAPPPAMGSALGPVVVCVRTARTGAPVLQRLVAALAASGAPVRGLVVWDREDPAAGAPVIEVS